MAEGLNTAEGYALAAESLSAQILLGEVEKLNKRAKDARDLAKAALALAPDDYEARLQYALADGFVTRTSGTLTALRKKLPTKSLVTIEAFRRDYPDDSRGLALHGAWHLGVIRKAGEKRGGKMFDASIAEGRKLYDLARQNAPYDIIIATNYAMVMLAIDAETYGPEFKPLLESVANWPAPNDTYKKLQARAVDILTVYEDTDDVEKRAERFLDGK